MANMQRYDLNYTVSHLTDDEKPAVTISTLEEQVLIISGEMPQRMTFREGKLIVQEGVHDYFTTVFEEMDKLSDKILCGAYSGEVNVKIIQKDSK